MKTEPATPNASWTGTYALWVAITSFPPAEAV